MRYFCFTVDLEEMRLVEDLGGIQEEEEGMYDIGEEGGNVLIDVLKEKGVNGTFFTTGKLAEKKKSLIKRLVREGNELACHAYRHGNVSKDPKSIAKGKRVLDRYSKTIGFRAPMGKINEPVLKEVERLFKYDSSILPAHVPTRYNNTCYPTKPFILAHNKTPLWEMPISAARYVRLPIGWWWFRNLGPWWTKSLSKLCDSPVVFNVHPWEVVEIPEGYGIRKDHTRNWDKMEKWLGDLIEWFGEKHKIVTMKEYYEKELVT